MKLSFRWLINMIKPYFDNQEEKEWRREINRKPNIDEDKQNNQPFAD